MPSRFAKIFDPGWHDAVRGKSKSLDVGGKDKWVPMSAGLVRPYSNWLTVQSTRMHSFLSLLGPIWYSRDYNLEESYMKV